jgi:Antirestriction protein (ArdA).
MNVTLCNRGHPEYGAATIPLPIPDEEYVHCMELLEALEIGNATSHDCYLDQISGAPPALDMLEGTMTNVDELDFLARSMERFTDDELAKFQCMIATREHWDMETLINLSFSCEQATVITDFSKLDNVGKSHYMTMHGGGVPAEEYRQLNGIGIARMLIADGRGKITPYGVLFENAMRIEPLYDGHSFPPYSDKPYVMEFTIETDREGELTFFLPQPEKRLERMLERAEIYSPGRLDVRTWRIDLPDAIADRLDVPHESLDVLNSLCAAVGRLDQKEMQKLSAVVNYAQPEYAIQMQHLAENLELFDFVESVQTAEEYGRYLIQESGHYEFDENLEAYYDYDKCGREQMESESGGYTPEGYVSYHGTMSIDELMMEDPAEQEQASRQEKGMQMGGLSC